jgi:hypothetical protein
MSVEKVFMQHFINSKVWNVFFRREKEKEIRSFSLLITTEVNFNDTRENV